MSSEQLPESEQPVSAPPAAKILPPSSSESPTKTNDHVSLKNGVKENGIEHDHNETNGEATEAAAENHVVEKEPSEASSAQIEHQAETTKINDSNTPAVEEKAAPVEQPKAAEEAKTVTEPTPVTGW